MALRCVRGTRSMSAKKKAADMAASFFLSLIRY
jgi:hypothetical protein